MGLYQGSQFVTRMASYAWGAELNIVFPHLTNPRDNHPNVTITEYGFLQHPGRKRNFQTDSLHDMLSTTGWTYATAYIHI